MRFDRNWELFKPFYKFCYCIILFFEQFSPRTVMCWCEPWGGSGRGEVALNYPEIFYLSFNVN